jgi:hypothetical protein
MIIPAIAGSTQEQGLLDIPKAFAAKGKVSPEWEARHGESDARIDVPGSRKGPFDRSPHFIDTHRLGG